MVHLFGFPIANVVIAFAPGAQDTMMVLALALHLDPVYVGAHHLARFLVVTVAIAVAARRVARQGSCQPTANRAAAHLALRISACGGSTTAARNGGFSVLNPSD